MKVIAVNGSPRKNRNTATLLEKGCEGAKSVGADVELVHLYELNFQGCTSCFACKRKDNKYLGRCAMKDDLTDVLKSISKCSVLLLGSPIYFASITGVMQAFLERLLFSNVTYKFGHESAFKGKVATGFIYTMNAPKEIETMNIPKELIKFYHYDNTFSYYRQCLLMILNGPSEFLLAHDTYQFDDYLQYEASMFDEKHKSQIRIEQFPIDCKKAFEMGARLATG